MLFYIYVDVMSRLHDSMLRCIVCTLFLFQSYVMICFSWQISNYTCTVWVWIQSMEMTPARDLKQSFFVNQFRKSWNRNHWQGIIWGMHLGSIREASGRHLRSIWEASGGIWDASGGIWRHLEASGGILRHPEASGAIWDIWRHLGSIWRHLEASGCIWRHLEASGGIWRHLEASWRHLGSIWETSGKHLGSIHLRFSPQA